MGDWVIVTKKDQSGLTFGIARLLGESRREIRRASVRNLSLGLLVVGLAIVGIVPISHCMTERLRALTGGVRQLAAGDFHLRVPAGPANEFGVLARAFNQMAQDLDHHQALAIAQERLHRELERLPPSGGSSICMQFQNRIQRRGDRCGNPQLGSAAHDRTLQRLDLDPFSQ